MRPTTFLLLAMSSIILSACSSTKTASVGTTNHGELTELYERPPIRFSRATVSCRIVESATESVDLPTLKLRYGRTGKVSKTREFTSPTDYAFPEMAPRALGARQFGPSFPITPTTPRKFKKSDLGWTLSADVTRRGGFVLVRGTLIQKRLGDVVLAAGKPFLPITAEAKDMLGRSVDVVLTENRAERRIVETREIPVMIAALPGEPYKIDLGSGVSAEFRVEVK